MAAVAAGGPVGGDGVADMTCFCFHPVKAITTGEGGIVTTDDDGLAEPLRRFARTGSRGGPDRRTSRAAAGTTTSARSASTTASPTSSARSAFSQLAPPRRLVERRNEVAARYRELLVLSYDPRGRTRVRFSLMPKETSRLVDIRTSKIDERIAALDDFVEAGYEVHLNFSPVIVHEGWLADWEELLEQVADNTNERTRQQLAAEIIFLTHNEGLHEVNLGWHPKAEDLLWRPDLQQLKRSQSGQWNVRYKSPWKGQWVQQLTDLLAVKLPDCRVRYAF